MKWIDPETGAECSELPHCDFRNPASVEAWHGPFGHSNNVRKIMLAHCKEIVRARTLEGPKPSEARIDDLARTSDEYVQFVIDNLYGRTEREANVIASNAR